MQDNTDSDSSSDPDWDEVESRVENSKEVLGHPMVDDESDPVEGEHYEVLAHTDWADAFVPTIVEWANGEVDQFTDLEQSRKNRAESEKALAEA